METKLTEEQLNKEIYNMGQYIKEKYFAIKNEAHQHLIFKKYLSEKLYPFIKKFNK